MTSFAQNADPTVVGVIAGVAVAGGAAPISNLSPADDGLGVVSDTVIVLHELLVTEDAALMVIWYMRDDPAAISAVPVLMMVLLTPAHDVPPSETPTDDSVELLLLVTLTYTYRELPANRRGLLALLGSYVLPLASTWMTVVPACAICNGTKQTIPMKSTITA